MMDNKETTQFIIDSWCEMLRQQGLQFTVDSKWIEDVCEVCVWIWPDHPSVQTALSFVAYGKNYPELMKSICLKTEALKEAADRLSCCE